MRLLLPRSEDQLKTANGRGADPIKSHVEAQGLKATALIPTLYIETKRFVRLGMSGGSYGSPGRPQWP